MHHTAQMMKALVIEGPGRARLDEVAVPEPGERQVRVRLEGCGVCGSNLPAWEGRPWFKYPLAPGELGHEGWGRVDAVGTGVARFAPGQRVALLSYHAFAEYDLAPESQVIALPKELDGKPFPAEPLGCAMNVLRRCDIHAGQTVAIVGVGFLGALLVSLAARAGASVIAISRRPFALSLARACGAAETIVLEDHKYVVDRVKKLTNGRGCERVIEVVGRQWPLDLASEITCERGRLIIAGYHQDGPRQINLQLWNWRGLDVINAHERDPGIYLDGMQAAVEAVASGALDPAPLYTHRFALKDASGAFTALCERPDGFLKALITA